MARPKPHVIADIINAKHKKIEIYRSLQAFAVMYRDHGINMMTQPDYMHTLYENQYDVPKKYQRTLFHHRAHAQNRAKELNELFKCDDYWVKEIDLSKK